MPPAPYRGPPAPSPRPRRRRKEGRGPRRAPGSGTGLLVRFLFLAGAALAVPLSAAPRIECDEPEFDFGTRPAHGALIHSFVIRNLGSEPLRILRVRACCGGRASPERSVVAPGSDMVLTAELELGGRTGEMRRTFFVVSDDPQRPELPLHFTGRIAAGPPAPPAGAPIRALPPELTLRAAEGPQARSLLVRSVRGEPFSVLRVERPADGWTVELRRWSPGAWRIGLEGLAPDPDLHGRTIRVLTDHPACPVVTIPVFVEPGEPRPGAPRPEAPGEAEK